MSTNATDLQGNATTFVLWGTKRPSATTGAQCMDTPVNVNNASVPIKQRNVWPAKILRFKLVHAARILRAAVTGDPPCND